MSLFAILAYLLFLSLIGEVEVRPGPPLRAVRSGGPEDRTDGLELDLLGL